MIWTVAIMTGPCEYVDDRFHCPYDAGSHRHVALPPWAACSHGFACRGADRVRVEAGGLLPVEGLDGILPRDKAVSTVVCIVCNKDTSTPPKRR